MKEKNDGSPAMRWLAERVRKDGTQVLVEKLLDEMEAEQAAAKLRQERGTRRKPRTAS